MADGDVTYLTGDLANGYMCGVFTSASTADVEVLCGFQPRRVVLRSALGGVIAKYEWHAGMDEGGYFLLQDTGSAQNYYYRASGGITLFAGELEGLADDGATMNEAKAEGFTIPASLEQLNDTASQDNFWEAWR